MCQKIKFAEFIHLIFYDYIHILFIFLGINCFCFFFFNIKKTTNMNKINKGILSNNNKIVEENFFIIDSNNLEKIQSHMYGFSVSKQGILTDNYYKILGYSEDPEPEGTYIMIRKIGNEIKINQDFFGSYGLYIYENKKINYFALSNSFLLLEEYLIGKQNISFNKDYADNLIISGVCTPSIHETLIKEIIKLPSNAFIIINIFTKIINIYQINYNENTIPIESEEGLKIIDKWVDKWGYIFRSLKKKTNNIISDLSGGYDTRVLLSILLNSGVNLNDIYISSNHDKLHTHKEDFKIAKNISSKYGLKLNKGRLDNQSIKWSTTDTLYCSLYTKLGIHKEFNFKEKFYKKPRFRFTGCGGENIRGYPVFPIKEYIEKISISGKKIKGHDEFYNSSMRICNRSLMLLKKEKTYDSDFDLSSDLYKKGRTRNHYGKASVEGFISNVYFLNPFMDSEIMKIKYNIEKYRHILISYILLRFGDNLINFPFERKRILDYESINKASKLKFRVPVYKIKTNFNKNFFIDTDRVSPVPPSKYNKDVNEYLKEVFKSSNFYKNINKVYNIDIYNFAKDYSRNTSYFPLRHVYGLLGIAKTIEYLSLNKKYLKAHN